jgi:hexosaminidase
MPAHAIVPLPVSIEPGSGTFVLGPSTVIVVPDADERVRGIGDALSRLIGRSVGAEAPRVQLASAGSAASAIHLQVAASAGSADEGYELTVASERVTIAGGSAAGVFYGVQTFRQLLPAWVEYESLRPVTERPIPLATVRVVDQPRYGWRGAMLDVARHFFGVEDVKRYIDLMALYKLNRLHLHLSDDQGWRIEIRSWPNLARHGGSTEVGGTPGGYYTQEDYAALAAYAAERFVTLVPEIDMPGHTNAALASYAELNCDDAARPLYTGIQVGFSAFCTEREVTYRFIDDVVREIAALTPGPFFHAGGDEVKTLTAEQYARFIERVEGIVTSHGKRMIGWDEVAAANLRPTTIVQHWRPKMSAALATSKGTQVIMSPADRAYIDMKYTKDTALGLDWAGLIPFQHAYDWDPATLPGGPPADAILGVEAPLWAETLAHLRDVEYMAFPRLAALAEVAWSPQPQRRWEDFRTRIAAHGPRWSALGVNYFRAPGIDWQP